MSGNKFGLNMPDGAGLLVYLEKGEKIRVGKGRVPARAVHELYVEGRSLVLPDGLEKKLGIEPGVRLEIVLDRGRIEILPPCPVSHRNGE